MHADSVWKEIISTLNPEPESREEVYWAYLNALVMVLEAKQPRLAPLVAVYVNHYRNPQAATLDGCIMRVAQGVDLSFSTFCDIVDIDIKSLPP
ncbi:MAG: hypothetical protein HYZ63_00035 [Candidatus Andersenbacteria bacterium]|nr:hypothetical protein [Candidatus Andersenbacteria bacterium]